jgi:hypothetical protein
MADTKTENEIIAVLFKLVGSLSHAIEQMESAIPKPVFIDTDSERKRWRFIDPSPQVFQVLMCVRIASALRASLILLINGCPTEIGVLLRTIDDFIGEIVFIDEVLPGGAGIVTTEHKQFLENYFFDNKRTADEMLADSINPSRKADFKKHRQKVQAAEARFTGGKDPFNAKKVVKTIDDAWSGVVHGSYQSVMEMYGGDSIEGAKFETSGTGARFTEYRHHIGLYIHRALNFFFKVAYNLGLGELAHDLRETRKHFEKSDVYTSR